MALYEFRCRTCESTFEVRRPMSEANLPATPAYPDHLGRGSLLVDREHRAERRHHGVKTLVREWQRLDITVDETHAHRFGLDSLTAALPETCAMIGGGDFTPAARRGQ